jgi:hypothetical protein
MSVLADRSFVCIHAIEGHHPNPHLRGLSLSDDTLSHEIQGNVESYAQPWRSTRPESLTPGEAFSTWSPPFVKKRVGLCAHFFRLPYKLFAI